MLDAQSALVLAKYGYGVAGNLDPSLPLPRGWSEVTLDPSKFPNVDPGGNNQYRIFVNDETQEVVMSFKGTDNFKNWKSDLSDSGFSEYASIREQANAAYVGLKALYPDYEFAAVGHSLGGGMAQTFALERGINVYAYNSLPISRGAIDSYFGGQAGYAAEVQTWMDSGRFAGFTNTPNDIATYWFRKEQYLPGATTTLPGTPLTDPVKAVLDSGAVLVLGPTGFFIEGVGLAIQGVDHTVGSLLDRSAGLGVDNSGHFIVPVGAILDIPVPIRAVTSELFSSPVTSVTAMGDKYVLDRLDGNRQILTIATDGQLTLLSARQDGAQVRQDVAPDGTYVTTINTPSGVSGSCSVLSSRITYDFQVPTFDGTDREQKFPDGSTLGTIDHFDKTGSLASQTFTATPAADESFSDQALQFILSELPAAMAAKLPSVQIASSSTIGLSFDFSANATGDPTVAVSTPTASGSTSTVFTPDDRITTLKPSTTSRKARRSPSPSRARMRACRNCRHWKRSTRAFTWSIGTASWPRKVYLRRSSQR